MDVLQAHVREAWITSGRANTASAQGDRVGDFLSFLYSFFYFNT